MAVERPPGSPVARGRLWLQLLASAGLLAALAWAIDVRAVAQALRRADLRWLALAALTQLPVIGLMAARWAFVAGRLGLALPFGTALREYWASVFINSVAPIGMTGDVARTARHARSVKTEPSGDLPTRAPWGRAILAAALDRAGAQLVLWGLAAALLPSLLRMPEGAQVFDPSRTGLALLAFAVVVTLVWKRVAPQTRAAFGRALWHPRALAVHVGCALLSFALHIASLAACGAAFGVSLPPLAWLAVGLWMLSLTSIPLFFAGWGVRELGVASAFAWVGADPNLGTASAFAFGLLALLVSLPGARFVLRSAHAPTGSPAQSSADQA